MDSACARVNGTIEIILSPDNIGSGWKMPVELSIKAIACNNPLDFGVGILVKLAF